MSAPSMKDKIVETMQSLPADATIEDAMERLLFLAKLERGLQQATGGATIPHGEIRRRFKAILAKVPNPSPDERDQMPTGRTRRRKKAGG